MRYKGFTLIELLAVIVILALIIAIAVPLILNVIDGAKKGAMNSDAKLIIDAINKKMALDDLYIYTDITEDNIEERLGIKATNYYDLVLTEVAGKPRVLIIGQGKWDGYTAYGNYNNMDVVDSDDYDVTPPVITMSGSNPLAIEKGDTYTEPGATANDNKDGNITADIVVTGIVDINIVGSYTITYAVEDVNGNKDTKTRIVNVTSPSYAGPKFRSSKGVNGPVLAKGMVPIKWDGSAWADTDIYDSAWYNYTTANKEWANARTADGSMWVWIPRYAYQIASGYHTITAGNMNIKFLKDKTLTAADGSTVETTPTYSGSSQTNYIVHSGFKFGTTDVTGIWIAKFQASGTIAALDIKPNVTALTNQSAGGMFTAVRNMETNSRYGWETSGNNIDTHLIKNVEWGVAAYLSKSNYGKNTEIWVNPSSNYKTGCAGSGPTDTYTSGCPYAYSTPNGLNASTTGNIYGIYDMSGGAFQPTVGYINGSSNASIYAGSWVSADIKYKDVYSKGTSDSATNNYQAASSKKGDAVYETSNTGMDYTSWYGDYSSMPELQEPIFVRGGPWAYTTRAGIFSFYTWAGNATGNYSIRPVLIVEEGL